MNRMYEGVKTWSPCVGCKFNCIYCEKSFQRQMKRRKKHCELCYRYEPHFHPERLDKVPNAKVIFACAFGDISFAKLDWLFEIFETVEKHDDKMFYIQTKDPRTFKEINDLYGIPKNVKLGITLETNLDSFNTPSKYKHYSEISRAPLPSKRTDTDFLEFTAGNLINYVTIEPILDFNSEFLRELKWISPEFVYIGYDNHNCKLPEPPLEKTLMLIEELRMFTEVRLKTIRKAWWEVNEARRV